MKPPRSFSLLTLLLIATMITVGFAAFKANSEVLKTRALYNKYSEEMGFLRIQDDTKLHVRKLGGYPQMSFAYRYKLPNNLRYKLKIGSGVIDPKSGYPPELISIEPTSGDIEQGTLVVSLVKIHTLPGDRWIIQCIDGTRLNSKTCDDEFEFAWLQSYLAAFPTDDQASSYNSYIRTGKLPMHPGMKVEGNGKMKVFDSGEDVVLYRRGEFHPSALASLTEKMKKDCETFMIWLEPFPPLQESPETLTN